MPTTVGILTFYEQDKLQALVIKPKISIYLGYFSDYEQFVLCSAEHEKRLITSGPGLSVWKMKPLVQPIPLLCANHYALHSTG